MSRPPAEGMCAHCGAGDVGTYEAGCGWVGQLALCHPNEPGRPDCYHLVTLYRHAMPCWICQQAMGRP